MLPEGVTAPEATLKTTGFVEPLKGLRWRFVPDDCVTLAAKRIVLGNATVMRPEALCLKPAPGHDFLVFDATEGWRAAFQARGVPLNVKTPDLKITGGATGSLGGEIDFDTTLADRSGMASMALHGRHDMPTGAGQASIRMKPTFFGPDAAEFTALFPIAHQWIGQLTGTVGVKARIGWGEGSDAGKAEVLLKDVALDQGLSLRAVSTRC